MGKDMMNSWCREVANQIRFAPDRKQVQEELYDHLLEHRKFLMEEGLLLEEAEEQAIASMGDPGELGRELDRIHNPWLGWLWWITRNLAFTMIYVMVFIPLAFWDKTDDFTFWLEAQRDPYLFSNSFAEEGEERRIHMPEGGELIATVSPRTETFGDYTISVLEGELMGWLVDDVEPGVEPYSHHELTVFLRVESDDLCAKFPEGLHYINAVDDLGIHYYSWEDNINVPNRPERTTAAQKLNPWSSSYVERTLPDWTKAMTIHNSLPDGEAWRPEWVELYLPEELGSFRFRLELDYRGVEL